MTSQSERINLYNEIFLYTRIMYETCSQMKFYFRGTKFLETHVAMYRKISCYGCLDACFEKRKEKTVSIAFPHALPFSLVKWRWQDIPRLYFVELEAHTSKADTFTSKKRAVRCGWRWPKSTQKWNQIDSTWKPRQEFVSRKVPGDSTITSDQVIMEILWARLLQLVRGRNQRHFTRNHLCVLLLKLQTNRLVMTSPSSRSAIWKDDVDYGSEVKNDSRLI